MSLKNCRARRIAYQTRPHCLKEIQFKGSHRLKKEERTREVKARHFIKTGTSSKSDMARPHSTEAGSNPLDHEITKC